jgi:SAM-dependent methyltransferase
MNLVEKSQCAPSSKNPPRTTEMDLRDMTEARRDEPIDPPTFWEIVADTNWGAYTSQIAKQAILRSHELSEKQTVALEIGCEGGRWSKLLTSLGWKMICVDTDQEVLKLCQKRNPTATCILASSSDEKIPCEANSIDLLLCIEVAPVIQSRWFLNEAFRVLREGGLIVGVFYNRLSLRGLFVRATGNREYYKHAYPLWRRNLSKHGFHISYEEGCCWFPFDRISNSRSIPFFSQLEKRFGLRQLTSVSPWIVFIARKI